MSYDNCRTTGPAAPRDKEFIGISAGQPARPVQSALAGMDTRISNIHSAIGDLEQRLQFVLREVQKQDAKEQSCAKGDPCKCAAYFQIDEMDRGAQAAISRIESIIERLEV